MKKYLFGIIYGVVLAAFTVYALLDTFVIVRVYGEAPPAGGTSGKRPENAIVTESSYVDDNISVTITQHRQYDTDIYVADVRVSSAEHLRTALACGVYGKHISQATSQMATENDAIFAVNGDYYGARDVGYVIRNGVLYREAGNAGREDLVIYKNGSFGIVREDEVSAKQLLEAGAWHVLSFGPALIHNGMLSVDENSKVDLELASNPRTAIGVIDELHYVFVTSDGRTSQSRGLSLFELASFMQTLGATVAYNLDGGGSATMWFCGRVVNRPTWRDEKIEERAVSDIVYIGY